MNDNFANEEHLRRVKHSHQVYAIGDSLTYGGVYLSRLSTLLGAQWGVINRGISGDTIAGMLARLNAEVTTSGDAEYLIVTGGINSPIAGHDAATIQAELQSIYTEAHNAGIKVIAGTITPFKTSAWWTADRQAVVEAVNTWILNTAINVDYKIDLYAALEDPSVPDTLLPAYASADWLHPSTAGYIAFADAIYAGSVFTPKASLNYTSMRLSGLTVYLNQNLQTSDAPKFNGITIGTNAFFVSKSKPYRVGMGGELSPGSTLGLLGNVAIGATTPFTQAAAPTGGLLVEGNSLFGAVADHAGEKLQVTGKGYFSDVLNAAGNLQLSGSTFYLSSTAGGTGLISSTSHATKGKINIGSLFYVDEVNGFSGIGTVAPTSKLDIQSETATSLVVKIQQFADANSPSIVLARSKGTSAAKTAVAFAQTVGTITFSGYDGSAMLGLASISGTVGNIPGANDMPGTLRFNVTPDGGTAPEEAMRIDYTKLVTCAAGLKVTGTLQLSGSGIYLNSTSGGTGLISSTSHATKGKVNIGSLLYVDETNGFAGIGTLAPTSKLDIQSETAASLIVKIQQFADAHSPVLTIARSTGNSTTKTAVTFGQAVGTINFAGYDGAAMLTLASITGIVGNTPGANDMPGTLRFNVTPDGGTVPEEAMKIDYTKLVTCFGDLKVVTGGIIIEGNSLFGAVADHAGEKLQVTGKGYFSDVLNAAGNLQLSGSTFYLSSTAGGTGLISSTSHATKGKINIGSLFYVDEVNGFAGIGTLSPSSTLDIQSQAATSLVVKIQQFADAHSSVLTFSRSKGTTDAKTAVTSTQTVGTINFKGYDGAAMIELASIVGIVGNTPGSNDMPGTLRFNVTPDGGTVPEEAMKIDYTKLVTCAAGLKVATGFGCNSKAPQTAYAGGAALAAYGAGANGFDSEANASALHAKVVSIEAALIANGIMS